MSKYRELVDDIEKAANLLNNLKARITKDFVLKLSLALDCEKDKIEIEFGRLKYSDSNKIFTWDFTLAISIMTSGGSVRAPLDFSFSFIKDTEDVSNISITYYKDKTANPPKGEIYNLSNPIDGLADLMFQDIKKKIKQCRLLPM